MKSNTKLVCLYMLVMMFVRFRTNLILTAKHMDVQNNKRLLGEGDRIFRSVLYFIGKLLLAAILIAIGVVVITYLFIPALGVIGAGSLLSASLSLSAACFLGAGFQIIDIKRACFDEAGQDKVNFLGPGRSLQQNGRILTQDNANSGTNKINGLDDLNVNDFQQYSLGEIVQKNALEGLDSGRSTINKNIKTIAIDLELRTGINASTNQPLTIERRKELFREYVKLKNEIAEEKAAFFKRRTTRGVVSSAWQFLTDLEKEINPEKFEKKKKEEYDQLVKESASADNATKKKATEKLKKMLEKYNNPSEKVKEDLAKKFAIKMIENGLTIDDLKSSFVIELISVTFPKIFKEKSKNKKEQIKKALENMPEESKQMAEIENSMNQADKIILPDNTKQVVEGGTLNEDVEEEVKKDQR